MQEPHGGAVMTAPLLTPEMMARAIVSEPDWWQPGPEFLIDFDALRAHIAHAIAFDRGYTRAAEREACALLVDEWCPTGRASDMDRIAAAIRARTQGGS